MTPSSSFKIQTKTNEVRWKQIKTELKENNQHNLRSSMCMKNYIASYIQESHGFAHGYNKLVHTVLHWEFSLPNPLKLGCKTSHKPHSITAHQAHTSFTLFNMSFTTNSK